MQYMDVSSANRFTDFALGDRDADFVTKYVQEQVGGWIAQVDCLASIAQSQPQCTYAAFRHSLASRWTFIAHTVEGTGELFEPLEAAIRERFIPALTGQEYLEMLKDSCLPSQLVWVVWG